MEAAPLTTLLLVVLLVAWTGWSYLRRELPVRRRGVLFALRAATLALLAVLLTRPEIGLPESDGEARWTLVDASTSMTFAAGSDEAPAARAERRLADLGEAAAVRTFGEGAPEDGGTSRLAPALRRAAEGGARRVRVLTDLRLADGPLALAEAERLGLAVEVEDAGGPLASAGIERLVAPATARAGEEVAVEATVFATAPLQGEAAVVTLRRTGADGVEETVGVDTVSLPAPGGGVALRTAVSLPDEAGPVVWSATVATPGDVVGADDRRHALTRVDPTAGIVALVSLRPDWEPRWLLPVLSDATGLPTRGWLRVGTDTFLSMGDGGLLSADSLARIADRARVLVLHGVGAEPPAWVEAVLESSPRLLVFPTGAGGARAVGMSDAGTLSGEWYPEPGGGGVFGALLAGIDLALLPPLTEVIGPGDGSPGAGGFAPALVVVRPGGAQAPALVVHEEAGERRVAVVAATGFWRWASRGGDPAEAHRRLFSGVAGWLLALEEAGTDRAVGPDRSVVPAGGNVRWSLPPGERVTLRIEGVDGVTRLDTLEVGDGGDMPLPAPPAGVSRWEVRTLAGTEGPWAGVLVSEAWTDELRWPRDTLVLAGTPGAAGATAGVVTPLRTSPWPWLVAIFLLCLEWILRRRWGLR